MYHFLTIVKSKNHKLKTIYTVINPIRGKWPTQKRSDLPKVTELVMPELEFNLETAWPFITEVVSRWWAGGKRNRAGTGSSIQQIFWALCAWHRVSDAWDTQMQGALSLQWVRDHGLLGKMRVRGHRHISKPCDSVVGYTFLLGLLRQQRYRVGKALVSMTPVMGYWIHGVSCLTSSKGHSSVTAYPLSQRRATKPGPLAVLSWSFPICIRRVGRVSLDVILFIWCLCW